MGKYTELYELWKEKCAAYPELSEELEKISGDEEQISDRFYQNLEFGTAGLRGVMGAGTNRMNIFTVRQATQGVAGSIAAELEKGSASAAIAYDTRINSRLFAETAAGVLAANDIKTYIFETPVPTPMLSFALRELKCTVGIIITASHNPAEYNGYKCYGSFGYQMTDEAAMRVYSCIKGIDIFEDIRFIPFEEGLRSGKISYIDESLSEAFLDRLSAKVINRDICKASDLSVIYTPLNGTGSLPVRKALDRLGIRNLRVPKEQEGPDGNFPSCPYPNPETRQVYEKAFEEARREPADLIIATDPDCDRMGAAVFDGSEFRLLSGNETGAVLTEYILSQYKAKGLMPKKPFVLKSFVTSSLISEIAGSYGAETVDLLTGFKYIGEYLERAKAAGREDDFIIGIEESCGYLFGTHARDKDAVSASQLLCEAAAYYKEKGLRLTDVLAGLYEKFGSFLNRVKSFSYEGESGKKKMAQLMASLRSTRPETLGGLSVVDVKDYRDSESTGLPSSDVIAFSLKGGNGITVRPSGTEPKIKIYITAVGKNFEEAEEIYGRLSAEAVKLSEV